MTKKKVVIIGGGVAGMSAAHELLKRDFEVEVYESNHIIGGKARSIGVPGTGTEGRHDLPAEHGFRFFPSYYKHVIATMAEIPFWDDDGTVHDQLTNVDTVSMASFRHRPIMLPAKLPHSLPDWFRFWRNYKRQPSMGVPFGERWFYMQRLWQVLTSCHARRDAEYEQIPWWDFLGADQRSLNYRRYLANMTRTLVAADPKKVSTRTNGNIWLQTLMGMWGPDGDRVLNGPTNEVWMHPWMQYLLGKGLKYYVNARATEFLTEGDAVSGVHLMQNPEIADWARPDHFARVLECSRYRIERSEPVADTDMVATGDYYIAAVPVEIMAQLIRREPDVVPFDTPSPDRDPADGSWSDLVRIDPRLTRLDGLRHSVQWMNGLLFYLKAPPNQSEAPNLPGHTIYVDPPFALTSIFQPQYWNYKIRLADYGDGSVTNILSVDISNWMENPGRIYDLPAAKLRRAQVAEEVWVDLQDSLCNDPSAKLHDDSLVNWQLDYDILPDPSLLLRNREPLLVNRVNTWRLRPDAATRVSNLLLASDYVRTHTDLATMEGANEAARRAVNAILIRSESKSARCELWSLEEPKWLAPYRDYDLKRLRAGKPWTAWVSLRVRFKSLWILLKGWLRGGKS